MFLMEDIAFHNISISRLKENFHNSQWVGIGDDFAVFDATYDNKIHWLEHPCRFDGYLALFCVKGNIRMTVNLNEFEMRDNTLFLCVPGNIVRINEVMSGCPAEEARYIGVAMTKDFVQGLRIDVNKLFNEGISFLDNPCVTLSSCEAEMSLRYLELICDVVKSDLSYKKDAVHSLLSSVFYVMAGVWTEHISEKRNTDVPSSRSKMIFEQFIKLVSQYHTQYRTVGFYADRLCLTPKYLSKLIRNATGRSAPEWIDAYVILEAKNMLKYSNVTIKEIVFRLNFPNQSVFYKFFKARTGMTPTEYRNS